MTVTPSQCEVRSRARRLACAADPALSTPPTVAYHKHDFCNWHTKLHKGRKSRRSHRSVFRELAGHVASPLFLAHIRASTGTAVQQTNCHPFRHGRWLWVHNGLIREFPLVKRDLVLAVDPSLYPAIEGSADSEVMFSLALSFGLEHDPPTAVERMVGFVEAVAGKQGIKEPLQMTVGTSYGDRVWAFRYSSEGRSRTLFYSTKLHTLRQLYPDNPSCTRSPRRPASSCPSRLAISAAPGTRCRSPATGSSTTATTSSTHSGPDRSRTNASHHSWAGQPRTYPVCSRSGASLSVSLGTWSTESCTGRGGIASPRRVIARPRCNLTPNGGGPGPGPVKGLSRRCIRPVPR